MAILFQEPLIQRSTVDANTDGDLLILTYIHHCLDPVFPADIAGVDADLGGTAFRSCNGQLIIEMDKKARQKGTDAKAEKKLIESETEDKLKSLTRTAAAKTEAEASRICSEIKEKTDEEISAIKAKTDKKCAKLDEIMKNESDKRCSEIIERIFRGTV